MNENEKDLELDVTEEYVEEDYTDAEYAEEDYFEAEAPVKKEKEPYEASLRSLVFGMLSVIVPVFSLMLMFMDTTVAIIAGLFAVIFAIIGIVSSFKARKFRGTKSHAMANVGRLLSIIGLIIAVAIVAYVVVQIVLAVATVIGIAAIYILIIILALMGL